jgi:hypothetical protein
VVALMLLRGRTPSGTQAGGQDTSVPANDASTAAATKAGEARGSPAGPGPADSTGRGPGAVAPRGANGGANRAGGPAPPIEAAPAPAVLDVQFAGQPFPLLIQAGDRRLGPLAGNGRLDVQAGPKRVRAIAESVFFDHDFGLMPFKAGSSTRLEIPDVGSAVAKVKGELYNGVQIFVDNRALSGSYPAQIQRIVAGPHTVRFTWTSGPFDGKDLKATFDIVAGGHFLIRAVPENEQVAVQQVR